jgi:hypothetical protein
MYTGSFVERQRHELLTPKINLASFSFRSATLLPEFFIFDSDSIEGFVELTCPAIIIEITGFKSNDTGLHPYAFCIIAMMSGCLMGFLHNTIPLGSEKGLGQILPA